MDKSKQTNVGVNVRDYIPGKDYVSSELRLHKIRSRTATLKLLELLSDLNIKEATKILDSFIWL
jgi:hypothetical protein